MNMNVDDEFSEPNVEKPKADSPALTEATSYTSSPEPSPTDNSKHDSVRRTLFKVNEDGASPKGTIANPIGFGTPSPGSVGHGRVLTPASAGSGNADTTISFTSSDTTAIPSWNLSKKDATERNVEVPLNHFMLSKSVPLLSSPPNFNLDETQALFNSPSSLASEATEASGTSEPPLAVKVTVNYALKQPVEDENEYDQTEDTVKPSLVMEDPPEEPTSCNAALNLTPVQLSELFLAFRQSALQRYQGTDPRSTPSPKKVVKPAKRNILVESPPPIMTSRHLSESSSQSDKSQSSFVRSIERELDALKMTSERDARMITSLQQAVNTQKELNSLKETEIEDKQTELLLSEQRFSSLRKEHEAFKERETELVETIQILKDELDKMTSLKSAPSDELEQLRLEEESSCKESRTAEFNIETQLVLYRAKEQEARIIELEMYLSEKEKENFDLKTKIDWLDNQQKEKVVHAQTQKVTESENLRSSENEETIKVSPVAVESLLKDIVKRLEAVEVEKSGKEPDSTKSNETSEERQQSPELGKIELECNGVKINVSEDPDTIEATNMMAKAERDVERNHSTWCCEFNLLPGE